MDQGWKQLPLFVIILLLSNAYGFKGGASSNANHQPSDYAFSPHAVQSSVSEVPVTGFLPEEMGRLEELNLLQFVNGGVSSSHESTDESGSPSSYPSVALSSPQGSVSQSAKAQSPWKQFASTSTGSSGTQSGSSTPFNLQGSTSYGGSLQHQGTSSQFGSGSPASYPSVALSSPQGSVSQSATVQRPWKQFTSTSTGSSGTQSGSSTPFNLQGSTSYGGSLQHQGTSSQFGSGSPASYPSVALSSPQLAVSQSATVQRPWKQFTSTSTGSSGTQSGSSTPFNLQGSTSYGGSLQHQGTSSQFGSGSPASYPSVALSSPQWAVSQSATVQRPWKQFTGSSGTQSGSPTLSNLQGSTTVGGSLQHQGTSSQFASGSPASYPSVALSSPQWAVSQSTKAQSPWKQFTSSSGTQSGSSTPFNLQGSTSYGGSLQHQGTSNQFASGSPASYPSVALSSPQWGVSQSATVQRPWKQFTSTSTGSSGTQSGSSTPFNLQGSTTYGGSLQHQGTSSQFGSGSPASYPSVALSSPQWAVSQSATVQRPWKQFTSTSTGSSGTQSGSSTPFNLQGSTTYGGSLQHQGTSSQFGSGSPASYPSVALSSPQWAVSQSATVQRPWKQFTGSSGTQSGSSTLSNLQGSTTVGGSLQHQGTSSQFGSGSPASYPSVALSSPQWAVRQSATVQRPWKQFTGSSGTQSGSSSLSNFQGSTTVGGSLQHQGTSSQFGSGSPASYPSVALSSPQWAVSQSATVQRPWKQFTSTSTGSSGTQSGSSTPFNLQGSTTYGGSLQHQALRESGSDASYTTKHLSSRYSAKGR